VKRVVAIAAGFLIVALAVPNVKLHLYGKNVPRRGRKMGHLTVLAPTTKEARARVLAARTALSPN